jgi:hypothetical protein
VTPSTLMAPSSRADAATELGHHVVDHHGVLGAVVLGVGEQERQQVVAAELVQGPEERLDAVGTGRDVRNGRRRPGPGRGPHPHRPECLGGQAKPGVPLALDVVEFDVGMVEEQQVLALDVEDERLGVDRPRPQHAAVEDGVEQEGGIGGLGGHTGDARDVDVGATAAVEELQVEHQRLTRTRQPDGEPFGHPVEEERLIAFGALGLAHRVAGPGRDEDLGLEPGGGDLGGLGHLGRQHAVGDEEHVGVETGALVAGPHLADHPEDLHHLSAGQHPFQRHHVVELKVAVLGDAHPELQWRGVLGSDDASDDGLIHGREGISGGDRNRLPARCPRPVPPGLPS